MLLSSQLLIILAVFSVQAWCQFGGLYGYNYGYGIPPPVPPPGYPGNLYGYGEYGYGYGFNRPGLVEDIVGGALMGTGLGLLFGKKKK